MKKIVILTASFLFPKTSSPDCIATMGVLRLASYVRDRPALGEKIYWKSGTPSGTKFIIDGNAYVHHLYMNSDLDWVHGGKSLTQDPRSPMITLC